MRIVYLEPRRDSRKSFYGKAIIGENKELYSYGQLVAEIKDGKPHLHGLWKSSATTLRHVKEWLYQNNFKVGSKSEIEKMYS